MSDFATKGQTRGKRRGFRFLSLLWLLTGLVFTLLTSCYLAFRSIGPLLDERYRAMFAISVVSFVAAAAIVRYVRRFALVNLWSIVIWSCLGLGVAALLVLSLSDLGYSAAYVALYYPVSVAVLAVWVLMIHKIENLKLAMIPEGLSGEVLQARHPQLVFQVLQSPDEVHALNGVDGIVVDVETPLSEPWLRAVGQWSAQRRRIYSASDLYESISGRVSLMRISSGIVAGFTGNVGYQGAKRMLDILGVITLSPIILLVMAVTAIAVKAEGRGPAIFSQQRIGLGGRSFTIYKFRSMVSGSEKDGPKFAAHRDGRVTKVGAFIRKFRIDEFPQMWNIFRGDMSLIGPRPEQPKFVAEFNEQIPYYSYRHQVRPGITGWAQVHQGYAADVEATRDKLEYDLYYIKHLSFWLDILIVFKTLRTIATGFGAR